ncbi:DUF1638 domain-containing protein [Methanosarcina sp.]|jgi:hypothetical protein|uniref:DUF1638 domain-containing protein n=1 Tax=Methanosarcina sp. TaxID=2213 RepID=UPI002CF83602|nr:DUF1638 domain-containing protein [Methanosarcina sp.]HOW14705.1 DUF1638 domain-containing protein [Methanosarcina sp.]
MPVLSIIACGMLEDELVHVLSRDCGIRQLIVVENRNSSGFLRKLRSGNHIPRTVSLDRVPMLLNSGFNPDFNSISKVLVKFPFLGKVYKKIESKKIRSKAVKKVDVVVNLLRLGLHADLELLKSEVYKNIREMAAFSDGILIFYGTCGHVLGDLEKDFIDIECPLFFLKDRDGETVEDCISAALGGNDAYARAMLEYRGKGTIYLTPMWASSWKSLEKESGSKDFNYRYLKNPGYCLAAKINTGIPYKSDFYQNVQEFALTFGMKIIDIKGSAEIAEQSYLAAMEAIVRKP